MKLNTDKLMEELLKEFKKVDEFRNKFRNDFIEVFTSLLHNRYQLEKNEKMNEALMIMAQQTISFTESIIEKDRSFPEYRKEEELKAMDDLLAKHQILESYEEEIKKIKQTLNDVVINHYPTIYEFTSFGYRLLEKKAQYHSYQFWSGFQQMKIEKE
ncbi:hypothetical protein [Sunxiuqinia indica]|uniref:hypothetical protein n=1 Tax=Sunxiuqinia indica TaxID=2692584 RepID=UPI001359BD3F|nr:hypothetical protein [Sunxiuqinia indica]